MSLFLDLEAEPGRFGCEYDQGRTTVKGRKCVLLYVVLFLPVVLLLNCAKPVAPLVPGLKSPVNGGTLSSLTPILTWTSGSTDAQYRIQVANDSQFQNLVIDESNLAGLSYSIPSGKLAEEHVYYWKVMAVRDGLASDWTPYWS